MPLLARACEDDKYQNSGKIHGRIFLVGFLLILRDALKKLRELRLQNIRRSPVAHKVQTGNALKRVILSQPMRVPPGS